MAMLAETRRKTKYVLQPKSKPLWASEGNEVHFGKKMLEKMGWSAGKGLGANEQGISEPVRAVFKQDAKGVGFKGDGNPFHTQDEFNALLSSLASENADKNSENVTFESLEEKSMKSKARVHYKKFTRGKDISRYSTIDLACIVGTGKKKEIEEEMSKDEIDRTGDEENAFGVTTIHGGSIADYFKMKWKSSKQSNKMTNDGDVADDITVNSEGTLPNVANAHLDSIEESKEQDCESLEAKNGHIESSDKKKKKSKSKDLEFEKEPQVADDITVNSEGTLPSATNTHFDSIEESKEQDYESLEAKNCHIESSDKKKKKKSKSKDLEFKKEPQVADDITINSEGTLPSATNTHFDSIEESKEQDYESLEAKNCYIESSYKKKKKKSKSKDLEFEKEPQVADDRTVNSEGTLPNVANAHLDSIEESKEQDYESLEAKNGHIESSDKKKKKKSKSKDLEFEKEPQVADDITINSEGTLSSVANTHFKPVTMNNQHLGTIEECKGQDHESLEAKYDHVEPSEKKKKKKSKSKGLEVEKELQVPCVFSRAENIPLEEGDCKKKKKNKKAEYNPLTLPFEEPDLSKDKKRKRKVDVDNFCVDALDEVTNLVQPDLKDTDEVHDDSCSKKKRRRDTRIYVNGNAPDLNINNLNENFADTGLSNESVCQITNEDANLKDHKKKRKRQEIETDEVMIEDLDRCQNYCEDGKALITKSYCGNSPEVVMDDNDKKYKEKRKIKELDHSDIKCIFDNEITEIDNGDVTEIVNDGLSYKSKKNKGKKKRKVEDTFDKRSYIEISDDENDEILAKKNILGDLKMLNSESPHKNKSKRKRNKFITELERIYLNGTANHKMSENHGVENNDIKDIGDVLEVVDVELHQKAERRKEKKKPRSSKVCDVQDGDGTSENIASHCEKSNNGEKVRDFPRLEELAPNKSKREKVDVLDIVEVNMIATVQNSEDICDSYVPHRSKKNKRKKQEIADVFDEHTVISDKHKERKTKNNSCTKISPDHEVTEKKKRRKANADGSEITITEKSVELEDDEKAEKRRKTKKDVKQTPAVDDKLVSILFPGSTLDRVIGYGAVK